MKLLVLEFINGGGFIGQPLPPSLAAEGGLMLQAVLDDLQTLPNLQLLVPLDSRSPAFALSANCQVRWQEHQPLLAQLPELLAECDAIWPIAPESDGILYSIAEMAEAAGTRLLLSPAATIALCADKLATSRLLSDAGLPVVLTQPLSPASALPIPFPKVLKPKDGAGCEGSFIVTDAEQYQQALTAIAGDFANYVEQPLAPGDAISLSCLFRDGKSWLLSCNRQIIASDGGRFELTGCLVNVDNPLRGFYQVLINQLAQAIPGLWGYVGIDLIESVDHGPLILEINPRLTTSYAGLCQATSINIAEQVLRMLDADVDLPVPGGQTIAITLH